MNAGKSTMLLQSAFNYQEMGMKVLLYLPSVVGQTHIRSRIGLSRKAVVFTPESTLAYVPSDYSCILVDEAQFLTKTQVGELCTVVDQLQTPVLCYGLRTDFQGELFEGSKALLALADEIVEIKTICSCGKKATMIQRIGSDGTLIVHGDQVDIGGNEKYDPVCRSCFTTNRRVAENIPKIPDMSSSWWW